MKNRKITSLNIKADDIIPADIEIMFQAVYLALDKEARRNEEAEFAEARRKEQAEFAARRKQEMKFVEARKKCSKS